MSPFLVLFLLPLALAQLPVAFLPAAPRSLFDARETSGEKLDSCQFLLKNLTDVETLAQHEYAALERCLYYSLAGEASKKMARLGIPHPIAAVPPNYLSHKPILVNFHQVTLQHFELNEFLRDIAIHGYMEIGWSDDRLSWSVDTWKTQTLKIQSLAHIWVPIFTAQNFDTALRNGDAFEMRRVEASSRGNVSALLAFSLRSFCDDSDFGAFPDDTYKCCFTLETHGNQEIIDFTTDNLPVFTDPKYFREYGWKVSGTLPTIIQDPSQPPQIGFCLNLTRYSSSLKIEMTVPLLACAVLFLLAPFIGAIKIQTAVKIFLLALQFVTLLLFSNRIESHLGSSASTPKLMRFLEFSIILNILSIAVSIIMMACGRIRRALPPWALLNKITNIVNQVVCVLHSSVEEDVEAVEKSGGAGAFQKDWTAAFSAMHALAMAVFSIVFVLGYLIIL